MSEFNKSHAKSFDVCEERELELAIGDEILMRSASRAAGVTNGERLRVAGWDEYNNPVSANGCIIRHRNLCHAYAATVRRVQGDSATRVIVGFDRHSVKTATRDAAYVAGSRGREFCEVQVESVSELSQIQNRCGDRKAVCEMALDPTRELQPELGELVTRIEAAMAGQRSAHPEKELVDLRAGKQERRKHRGQEHYQTPQVPARSHEREQERGMER